MSFHFRRLGRLGNQIGIPIPKDEHGYLGRECPETGCEGYFKIKPGTGLDGADLPCHCPYCGHSAPVDHFWTKEQLEYAESAALRQITDAARADLKALEFNIRPKGGFGVGLRMKVQPGRPVPIRRYREKDLETAVTCDACALEYAVFGVFGFCPDCRQHNSFAILMCNLALIRKQLALADTLRDLALRQHIIEDALENCVSSFDGFGRAACAVRGAQSTDLSKATAMSFQNLPRASKHLKVLFGIDFQASLPSDTWRLAHASFMKRHLLAHRSGVVDQQYKDETGDLSAPVGRRVVVEALQVEALVKAVEELGRSLVGLLPST